MMFGREVIFTYGPLAFLSTRVIEQYFVPLLLTYDALLASSLAFFFLVLLQKAVRKMDFFAIAAMALATKHALFCYPTATAFTVFLFWLYYFMESKRLFAFGLACLFGLILFFVKINYGFVTLPVLGLFIVSQVFWGQMSFRAALFSIVFLSISLVAGCFFLRVDLIGYVLNGFEIISGYNDNMALPHSNNSKPLLNLGMHFIQPPQHIVVKLVQLRRKNAISGPWLSQVHTQIAQCCCDRCKLYGVAPFAF